MRYVKFILIITLLCCISFLTAEDDIDTPEDLLLPEAEVINEEHPPDSDIQEEIEDSEQTEVFTGFYLPKSPAKAAFLSAFIPGAGQFYNEKYIKSVFWIGVQTGLIIRTVQHNENVNKYRHNRNDSVADKIKYNEAYNDRQSFIFWIGTSVLLSAMDAYVDAHLINFKQLRDEIHLRFEEHKVIISVRF